MSDASEYRDDYYTGPTFKKSPADDMRTMDQDSASEDVDKSSSVDRELDRDDRPLDAVRATTKCRSCLSSFTSDFKALRKSPSDLLFMLIIAFIDSLAYYAFSYVLIMHLGMEVGLPDAAAGLFYGIFGISISVAAFPMGFLADRMGIKASICSSAVLALVSRLAMAYAVLGRSTWMTAVILFGFVSPAIALIGPPIPTGIKRYTNSKTSDITFAIYYGVMNVAAFIATPIVDLWRIALTPDDVIALLPPYAVIIAITALLQIPIFFIALFGVRDVNLEENGVIGPIYIVDNGTTFGQRVKSVMKARNFWRGVVTVTCLIGAKSSFRYFDALYLPYVMRAYQDAATYPYLSLLAINPIIVIAATITGAITIVTRPFHPVTSMIVGTAIGGAAPFWMAAGPYLWNIILYVVFTSIGEIIWSPISYTFLVSLTGDGDEGAWMALVGMPVFLAKLLTGTLTGGLLSAFCPDPGTLCPPGGDTGPRSVIDNNNRFNPENCAYVNGTAQIPTPPPPQFGGNPNQCYALAIWGIIGLTSITSCFCLLIARKFIATEPADKENKPAEIGNGEFTVLASEKSLDQEDFS